MKITYNNHLIKQEKYKKTQKERGIFFYLTYILTKNYSCTNFMIAYISRSKNGNYLDLTISNNEYLKVYNYLEKIVIINGKKKFLFEKSINDYPSLYSLFKKYQKYYLNIIIK